MASIDIRPLSLGEILDGSFSLYRKHFQIFFGISLVPHLFVLAWAVGRMWLVTVPSIRARALGVPPPFSPMSTFVFSFAPSIVEFFLVYLFTQVPTAYTVSEIYLGRTISIRSAFGRMRRGFWRFAAYTFLSGTAILAATLLLLVPGISLACRLITALPAATVENLEPGGAFGRSFRLTRDYSWRALVIYLLYACLRLGAFALLFYPQRLASVLTRSDPTMATAWLELISVVSILEATLIGPFLTIAATVFYFDLRVRKEA